MDDIFLKPDQNPNVRNIETIPSFLKKLSARYFSNAYNF
jgi:hypothetical protein